MLVLAAITYVAFAFALASIAAAAGPPEGTPAPATKPATTGAASASAPSAAIAPFTWLEGCWRGSVNQREFREFWMPARGKLMIGVGQLSLNGVMQDYQYLRLEDNDGVVFSQFSGNRKVYAFKLASTSKDREDTVFTFDHTEATFPA
ncbi:MAG: DUF6265 family protein, partial [Casimicrobiaceae bacterium]